MIPHPRMSFGSRVNAFCLLLLTPLVFSVGHLSAYAAEKGIWLTDEVQIRLGDAFMDEGEYYRAVTEYKKLLILFPDSQDADYAWYKIGMAYYKGEEYQDCAESFSSLRAKYKQSEYLDEAQFFEALCFWRAEQLEPARMLFDDLARSHPDSRYAPLSLMGSSLVALDEENIAASSSRLVQLIKRYPHEESAQKAGKAIALLHQYQEIPQKSEVLAAVLSALVPGSGYMYAAHYGDGVTAFAINGLWIAGAVTGIRAEYYAVAGVLAGVGLPFYLGNIYGSANAAKKWNLKVKGELRDRIYLALDFRF